MSLPELEKRKKCFCHVFSQWLCLHEAHHSFNGCQTIIVKEMPNWEKINKHTNTKPTSMPHEDTILLNTGFKLPVHIFYTLLR